MKIKLHFEHPVSTSVWEALILTVCSSFCHPLQLLFSAPVQGNLHDIVKNLVAMILEGANFEIIDLGTDISPAKFMDAVKQHQPQAVGLSAQLTTTMPEMKDTIEALKEAGLRNKAKVMVGGAPVTYKYASYIGADLYAPDASSAATHARQLMR